MTFFTPRKDSPQPMAMSIDEVLIAEMPPAMRAKLESDGRVFGALIGTIILMIFVYLDYYVFPSLLNQTFGLNFVWSNLVRHSLFLVIVAMAVMPMAMKRWNVRREVRYRDKFGQWRWER